MACGLDLAPFTESIPALKTILRNFIMSENHSTKEQDSKKLRFLNLVKSKSLPKKKSVKLKTYHLAWVYKTSATNHQAGQKADKWLER